MGKKRELQQGYHTITDAHKHSNLEVLKPFVKFGIGAMSAIAHTLIGIVKSIPKPHDDDKPKHDKIVVRR